MEAEWGWAEPPLSGDGQRSALLNIDNNEQRQSTKQVSSNPLKNLLVVKMLKRFLNQT